MNCSTCGFFIPRNVCRDDLKTELKNINHDGTCGEITQQIMFFPYIYRANKAKCGKYMKDVTND